MSGVRFYDADSGRVVTIPAAELSSDAVKGNVDGVDGEVWFQPLVDEKCEFKHPPFNESVRIYIEQIQSAFAEHYSLSCEEWEDGFRRDDNASQQIAVWWYAADVYKEFARDESSENRRGDIYRCVVSCMVANRDTVWDIYQPHAIPFDHAERIVDRFFRNGYADGDGKKG